MAAKTKFDLIDTSCEEILNSIKDNKGITEKVLRYHLHRLILAYDSFIMETVSNARKAVKDEN